MGRLVLALHVKRVEWGDWQVDQRRVESLMSSKISWWSAERAQGLMSKHDHIVPLLLLKKYPFVALFSLLSTMNQGSFRCGVCGAVWIDCLLLSLHMGADEMLGRIWFSRCFQKENVDLCYWLSVFVWNWLMQHELLLLSISVRLSEMERRSSSTAHQAHSRFCWALDIKFGMTISIWMSISISISYIYMEIWKICKMKLAGRLQGWKK